jgi:hypothetical protein
MWGDFLGLDRREAWPEDVRPVLPPRDERLVTEFVPEGFFVREGTNHARACWTWFKTVVTQPSVVQGLAGWRDLDMAAEGGDGRALFVAGLGSYADLPQLAGSQMVDQRAVLYQAVAKVYQGMSPAAALARAQEQVMGGE